MSHAAPGTPKPGSAIPFLAKLTHLSTSGKDGHDGRLNFTCHPRTRFLDEHIDLAAHAESLEVNSRLDGKTDSGNYLARVARLEVIDVGPVTVHIFAYGVPGPMNEVLPVSLAVDNLAGHVIHLIAVNRSPLLIEA